jgi:hypothetical protein
MAHRSQHNVLSSFGHLRNGTSLIKPLSIKRIYIYKNNGTMEHLNVFNGLTPVFYGTRMEHTEHLNVFNDLAALSYSPYWYPTCGQLP